MGESDFARYLSGYLEDADITQGKFARMTGLTPAAISQLCSGEREPALGTILKVCDALNVSPNDLLGYTRQTIHSLRTKLAASEEKIRKAREALA